MCTDLEQIFMKKNISLYLEEFQYLPLILVLSAPEISFLIPMAVVLYPVGFTYHFSLYIRVAEILNTHLRNVYRLLVKNTYSCINS